MKDNKQNKLEILILKGLFTLTEKPIEMYLEFVHASLALFYFLQHVFDVDKVLHDPVT